MPLRLQAQAARLLRLEAVTQTLAPIEALGTLEALREEGAKASARLEECEEAREKAEARCIIE